VRLPNVDAASASERKVRDYLLSPTHTAGRAKARFFARFGFSAEAWRELAAALQRHAAALDVAMAEDTAFGTRYTIEGELESPDGRDPLVRTIWFVDNGETIPRLVTAYPVRGGKRHARA